jgi:hypothetical protein
LADAPREDTGSREWKNRIRVLRAPEGGEDRILRLLESALAKDADFMAAEGYPPTLPDYIPSTAITVTVQGERLLVDMAPLSGEGHDATFSIDLASGRLIRDSLVIGEVDPGPPPFLGED